MRLLLAAAVLAACGPAGRDPAGTPDALTGTDGSTIGDDGSIPTSAIVYAHSGSVLYAMNPATLAATQIGSMTGLDPQRSLLDLAVDRSGSIVGVSREKLYAIDANTGTLTLVSALDTTAQGFTSLSYAPTNPNDPNSAEMLVTANDQGNVYEIHLGGVQGATAILLGNYGKSGTQQIRSSGDIVAVSGLGIFATVDVGDNQDAPDYLAKIDPTNQWKATLMPQNTGFSKIFGLGFWGGKFYGFVDNGTDPSNPSVSLGGRMIQIDPVSGVGTEISAADIRWYGAGVTTAAPIL